jgi:hypothetical protein
LKQNSERPTSAMVGFHGTSADAANTILKIGFIYVRMSTSESERAAGFKPATLENQSSERTRTSPIETLAFLERTATVPSGGKAVGIAGRAVPLMLTKNCAPS